MGSALVNRAPKLGVVVQMRLDSTRLPRKALLPLAGTTLAGQVMRRLRAIPADEYILATDADGAEALAEAASEAGFQVFAGPKDDVLARYALAVEAFGLERLVRATGDNPCVSIPLARLALAETAADYVGLYGMPVGMGVEVIAASALREAAARAVQAYDREHVCPFLYARPTEFRLRRPLCPQAYRLPGARVTVDTKDDYDRARALFEALGPEADDEAVLAWLRDEKAEA